ncbi:Rv3212 family protein [Pseudonocardia xinjiangensis]|uniref:Rv3212 family protein n=1 Tax=Pseudonocardia xinjiangensis TaxID=75289 RepID=UPI003D93B677
MPVEPSERLRSPQPKPRLRPERRRPGDVVAAAVLALVLIGGGIAVWRTSPVAGTTDDPAAAPIVPPPPAGGVPTAFSEAWRAPSGATDHPVVAGPAVVTADGSRVVGRTAATGAESWSYTRDRSLCTVDFAFPDGGPGRLLALFAGTTGYCSELTALRPDTGTRLTASNPDVRPGTRLLADNTYVLATGADYLEVWRSDLVRTAEYGDVTTPVQTGRQPRPDCTYGPAAVGSGRVGVIERCPGEQTDRLTVLAADGEDGADAPDVQFSVPLPAAGATLVALTADRVAVALQNPPRLQVLDATGQQIGLVSLDVPDADLAADSTAPAATTGPTLGSTDGSGDRDDRVYWWTGSRTIALDGTDLTPLWTADGTLGPAQPYGGGLLVPVPAGLQVLDPARGTALRTLPVARADPDAPVRLAAAGNMLLEQRGTEVVALRPGG